MTKKLKMKNTKKIIVVIGLFFCTLFFHSCKWMNNKDDDTNFAVSDTASIQKIFIADKANHKIILIREKNNWKVNGKYIVRNDAISLLLQGIHDIHVNRPVSIKEHNGVVKEMASTGIKVKIFGKNDELLNAYYIGSIAKDYQGNYFLKEGSEQPYLVEIPGFEGEVSVRYIVDELDWRTKNITQIKPADIKTVSVIYFDERKDESFSIAPLNLNEYKMMPDKGKTDAKKCFELFSAFRNLNALAFTLPIAETDTFKKIRPFAMIEIIGSDNKKQTIELVHGPLSRRSKKQFDAFGKPMRFDEENYFAWINNHTDFIKVQDFALRNILKTKEYYLLKQ
ncbi:MAG: hypothetical protein RJA07_2258 [Bacteroidota bacterium]